MPLFGIPKVHKKVIADCIISSLAAFLPATYKTPFAIPNHFVATAPNDFLQADKGSGF